MYEWQQLIQTVVNEMDDAIMRRDDQALTLRALLDIALDYGFSGQEAFTRAFKALYGVTPGVYRRRPRPVVLRTRIYPFDRYIFGLGEIGMVKSEQGVKTYFYFVPGQYFKYIRPIRREK